MKPQMLPRLISLLRRQWVSPLDALHKVGCLSLAQRVSLDMREMNVQKKWVVLPNGKRVRAYRIIGGCK